MQNASSFWIPVAIIVVLIAAGGFFFIKPHLAVAPSQTASSTGQSAATTTYDLGNGVTAVGPSGAKIEIVNPTLPQPNLNHAVAFSPDISPDVKSVIQSQIANNTATLKTDPKNGEAWLALAVDYKVAGDYDAAENVWVYMTKVASSSYVAFANLGDLYMNFKKDYPKAEANYLQAVKLKPNYIDGYRNLFTLYHSFYKQNTSAAADIIAQGLKANPNNPDLLELQKQLKTQ